MLQKSYNGDHVVQTPPIVADVAAASSSFAIVVCNSPIAIATGRSDVGRDYMEGVGGAMPCSGTPLQSTACDGRRLWWGRATAGQTTPPRVVQATSPCI